MAYVVRRLGFFVVTLWAAVTLNFVLPRLMPGNPVQAMEAQHPHLNPQAIHALTVLLGGAYSGGLVSQYFQYWKNVLTLNFGISITTSFGTSVSTLVMHALPWTLGLVGVTTILAFILGTLIGLVSAWRRGSWLDSALPPIFIIVSAFPYFWVGLILIYFFAIKLGIFPQESAYSYLTDTPGLNLHYMVDVFEHAVLPGLTILVTAIGGWILTMRNNVITVMADDYVRMARAKGLKPWRIMWAYVGRNAVLPNLTGFAMSLGFVVSGALVVEYVFNYPGLGTLLLTAVNGLDYPLMQALFLLITVAVLLSVLAADIVTAMIDPRTRESR
ncbi:MAG TPA: ABC transporter permease [Streptosporangiaceae bacterium]|nr:ABC transporter permease [Streptosporangiaceae bacterium]